MSVMERMFQEAMRLTDTTALPAAVSLEIADLVPRPQIRKYFGEAALASLAESLRSYGVLEPILVRPRKDGRYEIIAGERRYRAACRAGLKTLPAIVLEVDEQQAKTLALLENLQREDLNPYEETLAILEWLELALSRPKEDVIALLQRMRDEVRKKVPHNVMGSQEAEEIQTLFRLLGKMTWESFVQNRLPLLSLPEDIRGALEEGAIPYTLALALRKVSDPTLRRQLLEEAKQGMSLRALRAKIQAHLQQTTSPPPFYRQALSRLAKVRLETLPPARQKAVERKLKELLRIIEETTGLRG
ncbi:MAG: ParB/RepB/Spo0J family partition protein [Methylohalobius sp.]|nr:ParB/RepB/Spo0J family partition protein [Methylohalobius sp.]